MIAKKSVDRDAIIEGGKLLGEILERLSREVRPGITTGELDALAEEWIVKAGGAPSFKGYQSEGDRSPYPATVCISVNEEVVHGIPSKRALKEGDIVGLDIGMEYKGFFTDTAVTVPVGRVSDEAQSLLDDTRQSLEAGIQAATIGNRIGDIGQAVSRVALPRRRGVIRELVGHGVGLAVHEDPQIPNYGDPGTGPKIVEHMVLALEPMFTMGDRKVTLADDGWTWVTKDGSLSAHFEHTILITKEGPVVVTRRPSERA